MEKLKKYGLTADVAGFFAMPGFAMLGIAAMLTFPVDWNWSLVRAALEPLMGWGGVKLFLISMGSLGGARALRSSWPATAQYLAAFGFMAALCPGLTLAAGMPPSIGAKGALYSLGMLILLVSGSGYLAARIFPLPPGDDKQESSDFRS